MRSRHCRPARNTSPPPLAALVALSLLLVPAAAAAGPPFVVVPLVLDGELGDTRFRTILRLTSTSFEMPRRVLGATFVDAETGAEIRIPLRFRGVRLEGREIPLDLPGSGRGSLQVRAAPQINVSAVLEAIGPRGVELLSLPVLGPEDFHPRDASPGEFFTHLHGSLSLEEGDEAWLALVRDPRMEAGPLRPPERQATCSALFEVEGNPRVDTAGVGVLLPPRRPILTPLRTLLADVFTPPPPQNPENGVDESQITGIAELQCTDPVYPLLLIVDGETGEPRIVEPAQRVARAFPPTP